MFEVATDIVALLVVVAFFAGMVDAIAGGGGLITVPVLLLVGASPITAISTNKVQAVFGAFTAALTYARAGHVDLRKQAVPAVIAFVAAVLGALLATQLPVDLIRYGLPVLLIGIALFFAFKPGLDDIDRAQRMSPMLVTMTIVPLVAAYDGLVGPGAGSFYMIGFVALGGYGVLRATAHTKLLNFASNLGGLVAFAVVASPWWAVGLAMGVSQIAGASVGSRMAMRSGAKIIKPLLVITTTALALRLLWEML